MLYCLLHNQKEFGQFFQNKTGQKSDKRIFSIDRDTCGESESEHALVQIWVENPQSDPLRYKSWWKMSVLARQKLSFMINYNKNTNTKNKRRLTKDCTKCWIWLLHNKCCIICIFSAVKMIREKLLIYHALCSWENWSFLKFWVNHWLRF